MSLKSRHRGYLRPLSHGIARVKSYLHSLVPVVFQCRFRINKIGAITPHYLTPITSIEWSRNWPQHSSHHLSLIQIMTQNIVIKTDADTPLLMWNSWSYRMWSKAVVLFIVGILRHLLEHQFIRYCTQTFRYESFRERLKVLQTNIRLIIHFT